MKACETCGNASGNTFTMTRDGETNMFDRFEWAIHGPSHPPRHRRKP